MDVQTLVTNLGATVGLTALTFSGVLKAIILLLVGMIVIRVLLTLWTGCWSGPRICPI